MKVLVAGELNADFIFRGFDSLPRPGRETIATEFSIELGSSSAITAAGLGRLGTPVSFLGKAGSDMVGHFCVNELRTAGVDTRLIQLRPEWKTGITAVFTADDRALSTYPGVMAALTVEDVTAPILQDFKHLHVASYFLQTGLQPGLQDLFQSAREMGLSVSFDPGCDPSGKWDPGIHAIFELCDILFVNEIELAEFSRSTTVESGLHALGTGPRIVIAKLGKKGSACWSEGQFYRASALDVQAIDTTGAGDSFNAGFLHAWLSGCPIQDCLQCGSICGSLSACRLGGCAGQPRWPEVEQRIRAMAG